MKPGWAWALLWGAAALWLGCGGDPLDELEAEASACEDGAPLALGELKPGAILLNAYFLQEDAARDVRAGRAQSPVLEEVFAKASAMGVAGLRTNGFNDAAEKVGDTAIQIARLQYDETAFRGLDRVLTRAHAHGLKLVLPLGNYWDAYGGARRYVQWSGAMDAVEGDRRFFADPAIVAHFQTHIANVLDRVNTEDGIRYGDHPAVLGWELLNEPRATGLSVEQMGAWTDAVAALIREKAPGHRVGTGEEGLDLSVFRRISASPAIDFGSMHYYPELWGVPAQEIPSHGAQWIGDRMAIARELGKPLFFGEFGLRNGGEFDLPERRALYRGWLRCAKRSGVAAIAPWMFANDARPDEWDEYTFYYRDGTQPDDPENRYTDLVIEATGT